MHVVGESQFSGSIVATAFTGDGSGLTDINAPSSGWTNVVSSGSSITYNTNIGYGGSVGIGTSSPVYLLTVGAAGTETTSLYVNGPSEFVGLVTSKDVTVGGALTAVGTYEINNVSSGLIRASSIGIGTTRPLQSLQVGSATTLGVSTNVFVVTDAGKVGVGTTNPTVDGLDIQTHMRLQSYSENVGILTIASNVVTVDLSLAQTFTLTLYDSVTSFTLTNPPSEATSFTIKLAQNGSGNYNVGIDTFKDSGGNSIDVYWPAGVVPIVTTTASKTDIYSFKTFDGGSSLFGIVGGQNFS